MEMTQKMKETASSIKCTCGNTWLEEVKICRINGDASVVLGQPSQVISNEFYLYKCHVCGTMNSPKVHLTTQDKQRQEYDEMVDQFNKDVDPSG